MENKKNSEEVLAKLKAEYEDFIGRFAAFQEEHAEDIQEMIRKAQEENWDLKPIDPQEIFNADSLIKEIEDNDEEDEIDGFHQLKHSAEVFHQVRAFMAEGRYFKKTFKELELEFFKNSLDFMEGWFENAQKALLSKKFDAGLPEAVKEMAINIAGLKGAIATLELEVAALQPHVSN